MWYNNIALWVDIVAKETPLLLTNENSFLLREIWTTRNGGGGIATDTCAGAEHFYPGNSVTLDTAYRVIKKH